VVPPFFATCLYKLPQGVKDAKRLTLADGNIYWKIQCFIPRCVAFFKIITRTNRDVSEISKKCRVLVVNFLKFNCK